MSKNDDLVIDIVKNMRDEQREHARNSAAHREESVKWQATSDARTTRIEDDLKAHIEGVVQNRDVIGIFNTRLEILEKPKEAKKWLYNKYMKVGGALSLTLTIAAAITKLLGLW